MRITHVVEHLPTGGLERVVVDLVQEQVRRGHQCQVVCVHDEGRLASELVEAGIPVHACHKRLGADLRALWRLRRHIGAHRTEVLHTHNNSAHYIALTASRGMRLPAVINTRHGMGALDPTNPRERKYVRTHGRTDRMVAVCTAAGEVLVQRGYVPRDKLRVVHNGIHSEQFVAANAAARARVRRELGLSPDTRLIGSVGRLNVAKDQVTLVEAIARLRRRGLNAALLLAGEGAMRATLEARIAELGVSAQVFLLGDRPDVGDWLQGFEVFTLSSTSEGYSIALLEAAASGLPIVATAVGGNGEIVRDGSNGLLVPPSSPEALAVALGAVLEDPERAQAMGEAGRAFMAAHGNVGAMAEGYAAVYAECL
ncbi:MAG TPA: glycosyltransferase [Rhodanobacteraceae bacterium]|nr:glycosyltransferase [Rhodanobacteraceae bacterium]